MHAGCGWLAACLHGRQAGKLVVFEMQQVEAWQPGPAGPARGSSQAVATQPDLAKPQQVQAGRQAGDGVVGGHQNLQMEPQRQKNDGKRGNVGRSSSSAAPGMASDLQQGRGRLQRCQAGNGIAANIQMQQAGKHPDPAGEISQLVAPQPQAGEAGSTAPQLCCRQGSRCEAVGRKVQLAQGCQCRQAGQAVQLVGRGV